MKYILQNPKCIEFYDSHPWINFNEMNTIFVELMEKVFKNKNDFFTPICEDEIKSSLKGLHDLMNDMNHRVKDHGEILRLTSESVSISKQNYVDEIQRAFLLHGNNEKKIIENVKDINTNFIDKMLYNINSEFPKISESMLKHLKNQQTDIIRETDKIMMNAIRNVNGQDELRNVINKNYEHLYSSLQRSFQEIKQNDGKLLDVGNDLRLFLEKQKNSTLKGKESEEKLESCLVRAFPYAEVVNQSGKPQSCDYLIQREGKCDILIENKDYANNVPNEELRKFVRDVEYQKKHGIMLSQNSGISQKQDYHIDFHGKNILIYLHFVKYDENKIQSAVQIIDHMSNMLSKHVEDENKLNIPMEKMQEINKEYLSFIQSKKTLIESIKKSSKDQIKMIEDFQMCKLTELMGTLFANIDTLTHKCDICGKIMKNHKGLVAHKRTCVKKQSKNIQETNIEIKQNNEVFDLNNLNETS